MGRITLTVIDLAKFFGVCEATIYSMVKEKKLPHFRLRGNIFFRQASIDAWIEKQEEQSVG